MGAADREVDEAPGRTRPPQRCRERGGRGPGDPRVAGDPRPGILQPGAVPEVEHGRGVLDLALATGHGGLRPGGTTAGVAGVRAAAPGEWAPRQADFAGVGGAPVLSADRPAGAPGGGRPAAAKGVREGPKTWPRAQPGTPGLVRLDAPGDQLPGGLVDLEGGRRPVPRPLADRTPVQALEVAQPPGRVPRDVVGGGADGAVLGEADRGGPSTLAAPDVDLVQPPPQPLEGGRGDPPMDRVADDRPGRPRCSHRGLGEPDEDDRCRRPQEASTEVPKFVPTPVESGTSELELLS